MSATKNSLPRIDKLAIGSIIDLELFHGQRYTHTDRVMFLGIKGDGLDREARFLMLSGDRETAYEFDAYRHNGRWAWGSSADIIRLVAVVATPADLLKV